MQRQTGLVAIGALLLGACAGDSTAVSSTTTTAIRPVTISVAPTITTTAAAPTTTTTFAPRFDSTGLFTFVSSAPVITNGPDLEWDWQYTDPGAAVYHDGSIHVFQNGFVGWPAPVGVGYGAATISGRPEDTDFLFVEATRGQETEVYLATHQGRPAADG